jgi:putative MATE family efflux protein
MKSNLSRDEILNGNLAKVILVLAIPVVINSLLQTMYNLTDTFWLGKLGTSELAAINLITPVQNMIINFGSGLTVAASVLISQYIGAKKDADAKAMGNQIYACAMIFAVVCAAACAFFAPHIVGWLGADGDTFVKSKTYLQLVILDMPFLYTVNMYVAFHQAEGDTVRPMLLNVLGICTNMILDPLFMMVFRWGVAGAALATVFAKAVPAVIAFVLLHSKKNLVYLELTKLHFEKDKLKSIVVVGLPSAIGGSTMQLGFLLMTKSVYAYGTEAMAAYGIGNKVNGVISLPSSGIGSAVSIIVGQNCGAGKLDRAKKGYQMARLMAVIFLFIGGMILSRDVVSTAVVNIFSDDPQVIGYAADFLSIMAFWCFTNGVHDSTSGLFRGSGHTMVNMVVDITRLWVFRLGTLYICQHYLLLGVRSVWYSVVVSNGLAALVLFITYTTGLWKKQVIKK